MAITSRSFSGTGRISTSLNPMRVSDPFNDVALPTIGSRAAGERFYSIYNILLFVPLNP